MRVYRGYMSWWTLATPDLPRREQTAWRVAERAGLPVPPTLHTFTGEEAGAIQRRVPGEALWGHLTPALVVPLAETLAQLHGARIADEARTHLPDVALPALFSRFARWAEEADDAPLREAVAAVTQRSQDIAERPAGLVHGDCHAGNLLSDGRTITASLDWEEAALGDPRIDVALMDAILRRRLSPAPADGFLRRYEALAGYALGPLQPWLDLTELRGQVVSAWVKHAVAQGRPLPTANPEVWVA